jgi:hypothetical protein
MVTKFPRRRHEEEGMQGFLVLQQAMEDPSEAAHSPRITVEKQ